MYFRLLLTDSRQNGFVVRLMTVFMTDSEMWMSTSLSCSACVERTYLTPSYKMVTPSCQQNSRTRQAACDGTPLHYDNDGPMEPMSPRKQESHSNFPCARCILEDSRKDSTLHRSQSSHGIFPVQLQRAELVFGERTITSFVARPGECFVHPRSNDRSVTAHLRSIPFRARYLSTVSVALLAAPAVSNTTGPPFSDRIPAPGTGCAFVLLVEDTLS